MEEPKAEQVLKFIYDLYENPDLSAKEHASSWLNDFQKSIYSWEISDKLLQNKNDLNSCYFAAQTMRTKIQNSFHELPEDSHLQLRDSIIAHIEHITVDTNPIITRQLCLALSNLVLLMATWQKPIEYLLEKFTKNSNSIQPLLLTLNYIPEEIDSKHLRLGENRRLELAKELESCSPIVLNFLQTCLMNDKTPLLKRIDMDAVKCFTAWVKMNTIPLEAAASSAVFAYSFQMLANPTVSDEKSLDTASDCICAVLESIELSKISEDTEKSIFFGIMQLNQVYLDSVAHEDADKSLVLCRIFTVVAETFLCRMTSSKPDAPHYSIQVLDSLVACARHFDYEVAQVTFNVWYKLSEELYQKDNERLTQLFEKHVEQLIEALFKHCQFDADHEGLIDDDTQFHEFRQKVSELIKDVVFIIKSIKCFEHMFNVLNSANVTWEATEAALFIMECIARNIFTEENHIVPKVVEAIIHLPENCHQAIRYTSVGVLGQLCDWICDHPATLDTILNFLMSSLQRKGAIASTAAHSLQLICSACHRHMIHHISNLIEIAKFVDMFEIEPYAAIVLLKGICNIISRLPNNEIPNVMRQLCNFQIEHLCKLMDANSKDDPTHRLDRLASIYRHIDPKLVKNEPHPATEVIIENWVVLSRAIDHYQNDAKVMERVIRCVKYGIRCISVQALPILESLVKQMVEIYAKKHHSCLLYLASVLVDEFGNDMRCIAGLLKMLEAFIEPTFNILQSENGLKNNPDTVDDFFRLSVRFIQRMPIHFLHSPIVAPIIQCATLACTLDHRDANMSVMKFLTNLLSNQKANQLPEVSPYVQQIVQVHGECLIVNLLGASIFHLHTSQLSDVVDVFAEIKGINNEVYCEALKKALGQLPRRNAGGSVTATDEQLTTFYDSMTKSDATLRHMTHAMQDFSRLFR